MEDLPKKVIEYDFWTDHCRLQLQDSPWQIDSQQRRMGLFRRCLRGIRLNRWTMRCRGVGQDRREGLKKKNTFGA